METLRFCGDVGERAGGVSVRLRLGVGCGVGMVCSLCFGVACGVGAVSGFGGASVLVARMVRLVVLVGFCLSSGVNPVGPG